MSGLICMAFPAAANATLASPLGPIHISRWQWIITQSGVLVTLLSTTCHLRDSRWAGEVRPDEEAVGVRWCNEYVKHSISRFLLPHRTLRVLLLWSSLRRAEHSLVVPDDSRLFDELHISISHPCHPSRRI
jgi:hypothetical protein